jgi:hypothetical protein
MNEINVEKTLLSPVKIIYKYKNDNKKTQNLIYIYVGNEGREYEDIFKKIKNLNLYETFISLSVKDIKRLEKGFGNKWFSYFFNTYHISFILDKIKTDKKYKNKILEKYDEKWFKDIINIFKLDIINTKSRYSYNDYLRREYREQQGKKLTKIEIDDFYDLDLKVLNKTDNILYKQLGGDEDDEDDEDNDVYEDINIDDDVMDDIEDIDILFEDIKITKTIKKTNDEISEIFNEKTFKSKKKNMISFNDKEDNSYEDEKLEYTYIKEFIYSQYIFMNDTIENLKNKISSSILNNDKFGKNNYLIPSRMYLWSEYINKNNIDKIMLCHTFSKNNELLDINIEPISLYNYENLEGKIETLVNTLKNYGKKINQTNNDYKIIYEFNNYIMNNEIYLIDIYNELGINYSGSNIKKENLINSYFKIYFPNLSKGTIDNIFDYLSNENNKEETYIENVFDTIYNNNLLENEVTELVEEIRIDNNPTYQKIFKYNNNITQSNMKCFLDINNEILEKDNLEKLNKINIKTGNYGKITLPTLDLFRIFNDFKTNKIYPYIQYNVASNDIIIKYEEDFMIESSKSNERISMIQKWFTRETPGVSFKVRITDEKFMNVNINEIGMLEYKLMLKEKDNTTYNDLQEIHKYIINLIKVINKNLDTHQNKVYINIPQKNDFKFKFLNTIKRYEFPNKEKINYDELKDFSKNFYPYVSLIVNENKSGAYLSFKRVSNYIIKSSITDRILDHLRYKNYNEENLITELIKLFNLTKEKAKNQIEEIKNSYAKRISNLKQSDELKKYKPPGTRVELVGQVDNPSNYKIDIKGTKDINEMNNILLFINSLLYLYYEIYINKNKSYTKINKKLDELTKIAKKRDLTDELYEKDEEKSDLKKAKELDKERFSYTADDTSESYSRLCQNSGENNKKRPLIISDKDVNKLIKEGYKLNKKTKNYEKNVISKKDGKITVRTIKLGNIYYTCNPKNNNEHTYIGFLTKTTAPNGLCYPCCFRKDPFKSEDEAKINFYKKCMGEKVKNDDSVNKPLSSADILYILQDTNKITERRIGYLPKFLEFLFNNKIKNEIETKNFYLTKTGKNGYYFKYGIDVNNYSFINSLMVVFDMSINEIKDHIIKFIKTDKKELHYMSLNQGEISVKYRQYDFIKYLENSDEISFDNLKDFLKIKGLFTKNGIYPIVLKRIDKFNESKTIEEFYLDIDDDLIDDQEYNIHQIKKMDLLVFIKDGKFYYPIINIKKPDETSKELKEPIAKFIENTELKNNIIQFINFTLDDINSNIINKTKTLKEIYLLINSLIKENKIDDDFSIEYQVIDNQYKARYAILQNKLFIPVRPSGIISKIPTVCLGINMDGCFSYSKFLSLEKTIKLSNELYEKSDKKMNIKIISSFYDNKTENEINCLGLITSNDNMIPIEPEKVKKSYLKENNLSYKDIPLEYEIDKKLQTYNKNNITHIDKRIEEVNKEKYDRESYQLFRFEFSYFINLDNNEKNKQKLIELIKNKNKKEIQQNILLICNDNKNSFIQTINEIPNVNDYRVNNQRLLCKNLDANDCKDNKHCIHKNGKCFFALTSDKLYEYIKKLTSEIIENKTKFMEIFQENSYVSDVVKYDNYNEYKGEKIIKMDMDYDKIEKKLYNIFGKNKISKIKKKKKYKSFEKDMVEKQINNPLKDLNSSYIQKIINNNYSILRAYVNGYYWIKHELYEPKDKNLKYYSVNQTEYLNLFISFIIDWLNNKDNKKILLNMSNNEKKILLKSINIDENLQNQINLFIINIIKNKHSKNYYILELFILNKIHKIPIVLLFNGIVKYYINNEIKITDDVNLLNKNNICINLEDIVNNQAQNIEIIYNK